MFFEIFFAVVFFVIAVCLHKDSLISLWPRVVDSQRIMTQKENYPSLLNFFYSLKDASVKTCKQALMERKAGQAELTAAAVCFLGEGTLEKLLESLHLSDSTPMKPTYTSSARTAASFCPVSCLPVLSKAKMPTLLLTYASVAS